MDLANLSWAYWHACAATPHIAPAHFGAAIESLQNAYIKSHPGLVAESWVPRALWKALRTNMAAAIDGAEISDQAKAALKVKLATFNTVDQRPRLQRSLRRRSAPHERLNRWEAQVRPQRFEFLGLSRREPKSHVRSTRRST